MITEKIICNGKQYAYIIRNPQNIKGKNFFGNKDNYLQVGILELKKGTKIEAHYHLPRSDEVKKTQEVLILLSGELEVCFYDVEKNVKVESTILLNGDILILLDGGHSFNAIMDTEFIEVKQGPYRGIEIDKKHLNYIN